MVYISRDETEGLLITALKMLRDGEETGETEECLLYSTFLKEGKKLFLVRGLKESTKDSLIIKVYTRQTNVIWPHRQKGFVFYQIDRIENKTLIRLLLILLRRTAPS